MSSIVRVEYMNKDGDIIAERITWDDGSDIYNGLTTISFIEDRDNDCYSGHRFFFEEMSNTENKSPMEAYSLISVRTTRKHWNLTRYLEKN